MKSSIIILLSLLLTTAIVAPSVITLIKLDKDTALFIDFNEEENKKEEKKEISEKDVFFYTWSNYTHSIESTPSNFISTYIEGCYTNSLEIFLRPPRHIG